MNNLKASIKEKALAELKKDIENFKQELEQNNNALTWIEKISLHRQKPYEKNRVETVIKRLTEKTEKKIQSVFNKIDNISAADDELKNPYVITINFYKSSTWGYCPKGFDNNRNVTSSITGCGYDKESTALAQLLNQNKTILKKMYKIKNDSPEKKNHDLFGYGSGYFELPAFKGGVGIECHVDILKKLGFKVTKTGNDTTTVLIIE